MAMLSQAILRAMALNAPRVQPSVTESGVYPMCSGLRFDLARMARRFPGRHLLFGRSRLMSVPMPLSRCVRKTEAHHYRAAQSGLRRLTRGRQLADLPRTPAASYRGGCNAEDPHEEWRPKRYGTAFGRNRRLPLHGLGTLTTPCPACPVSPACGVCSSGQTPLGNRPG
jgi:hypothetical protein